MGGDRVRAHRARPRARRRPALARAVGREDARRTGSRRLLEHVRAARALPRGRGGGRRLRGPVRRGRDDHHAGSGRRARRDEAPRGGPRPRRRGPARGAPQGDQRGRRRPNRGLGGPGDAPRRLRRRARAPRRDVRSDAGRSGRRRLILPRARKGAP